MKRMNDVQQGVWVITGGTIGKAWLKSRIEAYWKEANRLPFFIGVDGGVATLMECGYQPDYILGDFDTLEASYLEQIEGLGVQTTRLDPIKDMTDTHAVFEWLVNNRCTSLRLFGFTGTRVDHSMANMLVPFAYDALEDVCYENETNTIYFHRKPRVWTFEKDIHYYISIVPIEPLYVIETTGLKYDVKGQEFLVYDSFGVSNEIEGSTCQIHLGSGKGWIILSND